jgi:hypothetical protein
MGVNLAFLVAGEGRSTQTIGDPKGVPHIRFSDTILNPILELEEEIFM